MSSRWVVMVVAMVAAHFLPAARGQEPVENLKQFELKVVGPGGKPIPGAVVELRSKRAPTAEEIPKGTYLRPSPWGSFAKTDDQGVLVVKLPVSLRRFSLVIAIPGYGPYRAEWFSKDDPTVIPGRLTAELDLAWSVGGIVVDDAGKPVEGAKIRPSIDFKNRPGVTQLLGWGEQITTDAAGRWRFDNVPVSLGEVQVRINHPDFMPTWKTLPRDEFGVKGVDSPVAKIVLDRGLTVTGKVVDESGKPIAGALVRTGVHNDVRESRTGTDGVYRLTGCQPQPTRIVAWAPGRAIDMKEPLVERGMGPVDFTMKPGGHVRIRVLDHEGKPVPKARLVLHQWRTRFWSFDFDHINQLADENGVWTWNEAPLDEFKADICPPSGGMQSTDQPFVARAEEYVIRLLPPLVISGKVIDAETKAPVPEFQVMPGEKTSEGRISWDRGESLTARDGRYQNRPLRASFSHLVRIKAEGYRIAVSRDVKSAEGAVTIDFELTKANGVYAKVVTPANVSAAGAKIALGIAGAQINIKNGAIDEQSSFCPRETADDGGRFHFPAQDHDFQLVITHPSGFAHIRSRAEWGSARIIRLEAWSKVEGTYRIGGTPTAKAPISIKVFGHDSGGGHEGPNVFTTYQTTTDANGHFVFDRVFPGQGRVRRSLILAMGDGMTHVRSAREVDAIFPAGKTVHIDLGGSGRAIIGRLQPPEGSNEKVPWHLAIVQIVGGAGGYPDGASLLGALIDRDGSFRIDDTPAGDYSLSVSFVRNETLHLENYRFSVPDPAAEPIDLGVLKLEKR